MASATHRHAFALLIFFLASSSYLAMASDPSQLQDFCVGNINSPITINGLECKPSNDVTADDFFFQGLAKPGDTNNTVGSSVTPAFAQQYPGLNTLGISLARIDFAPYGENPPHTHPRATEVLLVLKGELLVGFVTSNPDNRLFAKVIQEGQTFVFPQGLIHFQINVGKYGAVALASLSSQNPGVITIANATFGSSPPIDTQILAKAFQLNAEIVNMLEAKFAKPKA